jgi:8-demethyl-8-alpha-L-rhamnosyltetracenomycin-C 2'-O-methyltransferase
MKPIVGNEYFAGASIRAWRDFFPSALIFGLDIQTKMFFNDNRIFCLETDQSNSNKLENTITEIKKINQNSHIDLIIDDGSHEISDMILSFNTLFKYLNIDGLYIIEDIKKKDMDIFKNMDLNGGEMIYSFSGYFDWDGFVVIKKII